MQIHLFVYRITSDSDIRSDSVIQLLSLSRDQSPFSSVIDLNLCFKLAECLKAFVLSFSSKIRWSKDDNNDHFHVLLLLIHIIHKF